ncbi:hypothetical protein AB205_0009100, partial [Aquarana catesbeiana]
GRKDSGHLRTPGTPHLIKGKSPHNNLRLWMQNPEDVEREVQEVGEIVTTTGDVDVVEE